MPVASHAALCPQTLAAGAYQRREPEHTALHRVLSQHWPAFVERAEEAGGLPDFVKREIESYQTCGLLEHGFARVECRECGFERLVAFSCKGRSVCPSCAGRRMNDTAAHLVDHVLPETPIRQWVCSLPFELRTPLGYDRKLCADVINAFVAEVMRFYRFRAKRLLGLQSVSLAHPGAVTLVQRFDSALRLNVHAHTLALDGVYVRDADSEKLVFHPLPSLTHEDVVEVATRTAERIRKVLQAHGRLAEEGCHAPEQDDFAIEQPALLSCYDAAVKGRDLLSERAGRPTLRLVDSAKATRAMNADKAGLVARVDGVSIHAATCINGRDRKRLERMCHYVTRPALAQDRLHILDDGRVRYDMKRVWADGTEAIVLDPLDFIARLCALVPAPYFNLTRFHGVLAPNANLRPQVVPGTGNVPAEPQQLELFTRDNIMHCLRAEPANDSPPCRSGRHPWAQLLKRTFAVDIAVCPRCSGKMRLVEMATTPGAIRQGLARQGLAPMPPPDPLPEVPGQLRLRFGQAS